MSKIEMLQAKFTALQKVNERLQAEMIRDHAAVSKFDGGNQTHHGCTLSIRIEEMGQRLSHNRPEDRPANA